MIRRHALLIRGLLLVLVAAVLVGALTVWQMAGVAPANEPSGLSPEHNAANAAVAVARSPDAGGVAPSSPASGSAFSSISASATVSVNRRATVPYSIASRILAGARRVVDNGTIYRETYEVIPYPNGDVSPEIGVCTDLVIRAFRNAGIDLQQRLHQDRKAHPGAYPTHLWEYKKPDKNIDHRRCQNLYIFFKRHAQSLTTSLDAGLRTEWKPGDVVFFKREGRKFPWHVAIVSEGSRADGAPMILHLFPPRASEAPITPYLPIHSHFRWPETAARQIRIRAEGG